MGIEAAILGSAVVGGVASNMAANKQAKAAQQAADQSTALQREQFEYQKQLQEPWQRAGLQGENRLLDLLGLSGNTGAQGYGSMAQPFSSLDLYKDPSYNFRVSEGLRALENSAAAKGGLMSGNFMKAATNYGQQAGSQEYQNAFQRYLAQQNYMLNPLQSIAGQGITSTNALGNYAGTFGQNAGNTMAAGTLGAGQARASGYMGLGNTLSGGVGQYLNYQQNQNMLDLIRQQQNNNFGKSIWSNNPLQSDVGYQNMGPG